MQVAQLAQDVPRYQATISGKVEGLREATLGRANELMRSVNRQIEQATKDAPAAPGAPKAEAEAAPPPLPVQVKERAATPLEIAKNVLGPIVHPLATRASC
jgi:hypothetical protein